MEGLTAIRFGSKRIPGYEIGDTDSPAIIWIQEWWGVTNIVKQQACATAARGYRVLIPDLYKGTLGHDIQEALHLMTSLDYHAAVEEIRDAAQYLLETGSPAVGITGSCMGGALAFAAAQHVHQLSAAAPFYGTPAREMPWIQPEQISIPVQYHTGMLDSIRGFSDPQTALELVGRMQAAGCDVQLFLYEGTGHSFLNAMVPEGVAFLQRWGYGAPPQEQVQLAFERLIEFFDRQLKAKAGGV